MFYQQALKPQELANILMCGNVRESFFMIQAQLPNRCFRAAVYKYDNEYFLLKDTHLFSCMETVKDNPRGNEDEILPYIEEALEDNLYAIIDEGFILLDLSTFVKMGIDETKLDIQYYEFSD